MKPTTELFLAAHSRTQRGKAVQALRRTGTIPAVVYGHESTTRAIALDAARFQHIWRQAGESSLIDLVVDGETPVKTIIQDVQYEPRSNRVVHVDFHQVNMKEKVHVDVNLEFTGEAPAVKELGGTLLTLKSAIAIECLPGDLVKAITVDVRMLKTFDDALHVRDLPVPATIVVKDNPDDVVAQVEAPRTEAELAELDTAVQEDVTQVEVEKAEPKETEEETPAVAE